MAQQETMAENMRLLYVALTRAKHACLVVWGQTRKAPSSPLAHLLHPSVRSASDDPEDFKKRVRSLSDEAMLKDLRALAHGSSGGILLSKMEPLRPIPLRPRETWSQPLKLPKVTRVVHATVRDSSFSELSRSHETLSTSTVAVNSENGADKVTLNEFPAGPKAGLALHAVLEHLDFQQISSSSSGELIASTLRRFGFDKQWQKIVQQALTEILDTPIVGTAQVFALRDICRSRRLDELEFTFPACVEGQALDAGTLAALFEKYDSKQRFSDYTRSLAKLTFAPLCGYLHGYIDIAFEHQGRWYLADYKSNHLGAHGSDYQASQLWKAMTEHHYILQYHLYTVALHKYLASRIPDYNWERHFGGIYYFFLRGMSPKFPLGSGVIHELPDRRLIQALSDILDGAPARTAGP